VTLFIKKIEAKFMAQMKPKSVAVSFNSNDIYPQPTASMPFEQSRDYFFT
jgi:Xaa-Pro aminopeptidase